MTKFDKTDKWLREKYRYQNMGPTEIADLEECNVTPGAISRWVKKFGITKRHRDEEWLQQKYVEENMTSTEIADICDVCSQTVLNNLEKFDIDRPSNKEKWSVYEAPLKGVTGSDHPWWGRTGEDHPRYKGEDYSWRKSPEWRRIKKMVRNRDNNICQICENKNELHVHHIVPVSEGGQKFDPENLMTLCGDCHREVHSEYYNSDSVNSAERDWVAPEEAVYQ